MWVARRLRARLEQDRAGDHQVRQTVEVEVRHRDRRDAAAAVADEPLLGLDSGSNRRRQDAAVLGGSHPPGVRPPLRAGNRE